MCRIKNRTVLSAKVVLAGLALLASTVSAQEVVELSKLTFQEFERLAISADPVASQLRNQASSMRHMAVGSAQLPDPIVQLGFENVPTDTFAFDEEEMTMKVIGFQQTFPPLGSLQSRGDEFTARARAEDAMVDDRELMVLLGVRESWLELYYQFQAQALIKETEKTFKELVEIAKFRYRAGRGTQFDMVQAEVELGLLHEKVAEIEMEKDVILAELGSWIGASHIERPAPVRFPVLPPLPSQDSVRSKINGHPSVIAAQARVAAGRAGVDRARAELLPETMLQLSYGQRSFEDMPDNVSGMLSFSLPLFTGKRQDRMVQASRAEVEAAKDEVEAQRRKLYEMVESGYRRWARLDERYSHFEKEVLPLAAQYSKTTLASYQSGVAEFSEQVRARVQELEYGLMALRLQIDRTKEHANLLYLAGDKAL